MIHLFESSMQKGAYMNDLKRILVVDDEKKVLFVFRGALRSLGEGYEVVTAADGYEALEKARQQPFDLLMTDLKMPDIDGIDLTREMLAINPNLTVIWMTAYGCHRVASKAAQLGVCCCLNKPLTIDEIRRAVHDALNNGSSSSVADQMSRRSALG